MRAAQRERPAGSIRGLIQLGLGLVTLLSFGLSHVCATYLELIMPSAYLTNMLDDLRQL
jgi:hypothetical protein